MTRDRITRWLLIPRLRTRMKAKRYRRGFVDLYAVDCSEEELKDVQAITETEITRLCNGIRKFLETTQKPPRMRCLCFGVNAPFDAAPPGIRDWLSSPFGRGVWISELRVCIALFGTGTTLWRILVHELVHGLLELLSGGFPYPIAIQEGFARRAEYLLPRDTDRGAAAARPGDGTQQSERFLTEDECMTIRELLQFNPREHWRMNMGAFAQMTALSYWLNVFLFGLGREFPQMRRILPELRSRNISAPDAVYQWVCGAAQMTKEELEARFLEFCTGRLLCNEEQRGDKTRVEQVNDLPIP